MSDMSAFHRVEPEDVEMMTAMAFWPRARRLVHYDGAVRAVALAAVREQAAPSQYDATGAQVEPEVPVDPTAEDIRAMRDAARRKRYPASQFGEVHYVSDHEIVRKAGTDA